MHVSTRRSPFSVRRAAILLGLVTIAVFCLIGARVSDARSAASPSSDRASGAFLRIGATGRDIDSLNPFVAVNVQAWSAFTYIYPLLVQYGKDMSLQPGFAKSWTISRDGKTITFKTAAGAKWSDGQPLTSADAAWTLNAILKYKGGPAANFAGAVKNITAVAAPTPTSLVIRFSKPTSTALGQLEKIWILPEHIWAPQAGSDGAGLRTFSNAAPIVSGGPFQLSSYQQSQVATFSANPNYYGTKPKISGFGIQLFANADAVLAALKNNQIDMAQTISALAVPQLSSDQNIRVVRAPGGVWQELYFYSDAKKKSNHKELLNPRVRQALEDAINYKQFIAVVEFGGANVAPNALPSGPWQAGAKLPTYSPAAANAILNSLGYKKGSRGIRVANGHPMSYGLIAPQGVGDPERRAQLLTRYFKAIGVELKPQIVDNSAFLKAISSTKTDMFLDGSTTPPDPDSILSYPTCGNLGGFNESGYCNPAYDKLYGKQAAQFGSARNTTVIAMEQILARDLPYIVMDRLQTIEAWRSGWTGYFPTPPGSLSNLSTVPLTSVSKG